ncbi:MAG: pyrroloquinoline quinone biosynthesis protein B [Candidatus Azotimanducaceae bacterium]|jgi:pyrroloquinoline quinone biosynthesis protein B
MSAYRNTLTSLLTLCVWACCSLPIQATPYLYILGVAQDAGYPQAGCYAQHCLPGWADTQLRRGATSMALIDDEQSYLFEATPNLPSQLYALHGHAPDATLSGIFVTHAHIGHYAGLMFLGREAMGARGMPVYAMPRMSLYLRDNGPWSQLVALNNITLVALQHEQPISLGRVSITPLLVPHRDEFSETVGYQIDGPSKTAVFIPDINKWEQWDTKLENLLQRVDYALIDATFYADGELPGRDMSKVPHPLVSESMALLNHMPVAQRNKVWFIHMNHTNPLLNPESQASKAVSAAGYHVAFEGLRLAL